MRKRKKKESLEAQEEKERLERKAIANLLESLIEEKESGQYSTSRRVEEDYDFDIDFDD